MEVIVDDTNILIDLANTGLMPKCQGLEISFRTTDMVVSELHNCRQREIISKYIADGGLSVVKIQNDDLMEVVNTYQQLSSSFSLTLADISVMLLAEHLGCRLLTDDKKLIHQAHSRGIEANGILWLTGLMVEKRIVSPLEMADYLHKLMDTNERAPRQLILERITEYTNTIGKGDD